MINPDLKINTEALRLIALYGGNPIVMRSRIKETDHYKTLTEIEKAQLLDFSDEVLLKYIK